MHIPIGLTAYKVVGTEYRVTNIVHKVIATSLIVVVLRFLNRLEEFPQFFSDALKTT